MSSERPTRSTRRNRPSSSTSRPAPEETAHPQQRDEDDDDDLDDEDVALQQNLKCYTRKCKLNGVLNDTVNQEILQVCVDLLLLVITQRTYILL